MTGGRLRRAESLSGAKIWKGYLAEETKTMKGSAIKL